MNLVTTVINKEKCLYEFLIRKKKNIMFNCTMIFKPLALTIFLLSTFLVMSIPANAADYFVATSGSDKNPGTLDNPLRNISYAVNKAIAGDTIYLINGTWTNEHVVFENCGTINNPIRLIKYNGTVKLDGLDRTGNGIYLKDKSYIVIDGLHIKNYLTGIYIQDSASDVEISNLTISDISKSGIQFYGTKDYSINNISIHDFKIFRFGSLKSAPCSGISHEFGFNNSHDIEIYNFEIADANSNGAGIRFRRASNLHIHDGKIYNMASGQDGIYLGTSLSNSIIENVTIKNTGWHGIGLNSGDYINDTSEKYLYNNTIKNCIICYPGHNAIDFHTGNVNSTVENVTIFGSPEGLQGINYMWNGTGLTVRNTNISGLLKGMYLLQPNASIWDCTIANISEGAIYITKPNVDINNCNFSGSNYVQTFWIAANNFTINNTRMGERKTVRVAAGSGTLLDIIDSEYTINGNNATVTIEYTDGTVFSVTKSPYVLNPLWAQNCSYSIFNAPVTATTIKVISYPMTVRPSTEPVIINVNKFDTTLSVENLLVNFTVNSPDDNNVLFNIGELKPENYYLIKRDGSNFTLLKANSSGQIQFSNSKWPKEHTFTVEETSNPSNESPISSAGSNQTVPFGSTVYFNGSESTGNNIVSYSWDFDASNGIQQDATGPIVNHTYETAGEYTVTLTVTDANGNTDSDTCTITVLEKSKATKVHISSPNITLPGKTFTVDILIDPSISINGAQLDILFDSSMVSITGVTEGDIFKQSEASTVFNSGTIDNSAGIVKNVYGYILGAVKVSAPGTFATVDLTAGNRTGMAEFNLSNVIISDTSSRSAPYTVTNASVLIDTAPVMDPICYLKSVDEKSALTFKVTAKDADGDKLILSASGLPEGAEFNTGSGDFSWTPAVGQAGVYTFTFEVSDGYLTDSENVTVTVNKLNNPPVIDSFEPPDGSSFSEGERIEVSVNASDADGQALSYSIRIDGVEYSTENTYVWETGYSSSGNHTIEVAVSDGIEKVTEQNNIYINNYHPRWDVNQDGVVNILDITVIAQNYGSSTVKPYPRWDVNQDGVINIQDLTLAGYYFGETVV
ncbi:PKD domain-containing protein [Methanosarcina siciliae]|nr:PKD domain-containing protein [Methanosarcina siciliae]